MGLALLQEKNLVAAWKQKDARRIKKRKKNIFSGKKSKWGTFNLDLSYFFLTLITGLTKIVLLVTFSYGLFSGYRFITQSPQFEVSRIMLAGHKQLSNEELNLWIGPIIGENIFQLELDKISQRLVEHPWVESASARKVFPQEVNIVIKERTPFAKIQLEQVYVMDNFGVLLGKEVGGISKLPVITGINAKKIKLGSNVADAEIIHGLQIMHSLNQLSIFKKNPIENIHISSRSRVTFSTHNHDIQVHIRPEIVHKNFKNLVLVLGAIETNEFGLKYIDLSFSNKIVVKHREVVKEKFQKNTKT
jgi:cell division protein FtsQ